MKIVCDITILNRQCPTMKNRSIKSTLALTMHPPNKPDSKLFLILFTSQNKTGIRYKVKDNIEKVFVKFMNDGKATISFKEPTQDLQIKCESVQLKCFLRILNKGLKGTEDMCKIGLSNLSATAAPSNSHPVKKLSITSRGDYPIKGFPRTITSLNINGIKRCRFDSQILFLKNLTILNLSNNCIKTIPKNLGKLNLIEINFSDNNLGDKLEGCNFQWLDSYEIQKSLIHLDLSRNQLIGFPYHLIKFKKLSTLKLDFNEIKKIPFAISKIQGSLRFFHISNNKLETLPSTMGQMTFDTVDISSNLFMLQPSLEYKSIHLNNEKNHNHFPSLWQLAGQIVITNRIYYSPENLPKILIDILERTPQCYCGRPCFTGSIKERSITLELQAKNFIFDNCRSVISDVIFCIKCGQNQR